MKNIILLFCILSLFSCRRAQKVRPVLYETKMAIEIVELTKDIEHFQMYERKQIRLKLLEIQEYIMKQLTDRIDKHPHWSTHSDE